MDNLRWLPATKILTILNLAVAFTSLCIVVWFGSNRFPDEQRKRKLSWQHDDLPIWLSWAWICFLFTVIIQDCVLILLLSAHQTASTKSLPTKLVIWKVFNFVSIANLVAFLSLLPILTINLTLVLYTCLIELILRITFDYTVYCFTQEVKQFNTSILRESQLPTRAEQNMYVDQTIQNTYEVIQ